jgi:hypothetical protein
MQYHDTGWVGILVTLLFCAFILLNIKRAHAVRPLTIRKIPGLNAIDDAVGRATEMGRPLLMVPGIGGLSTVVMQALNIFVHVSRLAARLATPIRLCCSDAAVYTVAQEVISDVYRSEGLSERYDPDSVRFISARQFAFAAGVAGLIYRDQVAASFLLGSFYAESLVIAEAGSVVGAIQVAGSTENSQTPFFIAACDYVLIADEFYAASAYLTKEPVSLGSLVGQDWCKIFLVNLILIGVLVNSLDKGIAAWQRQEIKADKKLPFYRLLSPESLPRKHGP